MGREKDMKIVMLVLAIVLVVFVAILLGGLVVVGHPPPTP